MESSPSTSQTISLNQVVRTSYNTGPYRIVQISSECTCPSFLDNINSLTPCESEPHFHLTVTDVEPTRRGYSYLNGYRKDGTSVWSDDFLIFDGLTEGHTGDLFALTNVT